VFIFGTFRKKYLVSGEKNHRLIEVRSPEGLPAILSVAFVVGVTSGINEHLSWIQ
jgi:hypothetical protein